jgi:hypothetical protein
MGLTEDQMMKTASIAFLALLLAACATSGPSLVTEEDISAASDHELCLAFKAQGSNAVRAELVRRDLFSSREWRFIDDGQIHIGMDDLAVICSWGDPGREVVNTRTDNGDPDEQVWIYNECPICDEFRVYLRGGEVERWES